MFKAGDRVVLVESHNYAGSTGTVEYTSLRGMTKEPFVAIIWDKNSLVGDLCPRSGESFKDVRLLTPLEKLL